MRDKILNDLKEAMKNQDKEKLSVIRMLKGSIQMEELNKKYELYITTAYIFRDDKEKSSELLKNKFDYLIKNFPFIQPEQYIFTSNKEIVECQIKIDDKPSNLDGDAELKLLFTAYHNKNIPNEELQKNNLVRVNNWNEIGKILL